MFYIKYYLYKTNTEKQEQIFFEMFIPVDLY